ncbi:MAG: flagellar hook-basal body complex protein FliE [Lachnospiraceae bacterium]|nr:flagellar hook-basal body complex protein FliE [Lachnospiraceae bacterium]
MQVAPTYEPHLMTNRAVRGAIRTDITKLNNEGDKEDLFGSLLDSAINNINKTNGYLSNMENEEVKFALGETDNAHDLGVAIQKASTALQYTVAVKNAAMEAYRQIMQMQI